MENQSKLRINQSSELEVNQPKQVKVFSSKLGKMIDVDIINSDSQVTTRVMLVVDEDE
jgi:hypothetical protein